MADRVPQHLKGPGSVPLRAKVRLHNVTLMGQAVVDEEGEDEAKQKKTETSVPIPADKLSHIGNFLALRLCYGAPVPNRFA
eukprot:3830662-Amphidinium_carterae.1